jgi:hydrogenase-4 membrane subunit HyfE
MKRVHVLASIAAILAIAWTSGFLVAVTAAVLALYVREVLVRQLLQERFKEAVAYIESEDAACTCLDCKPDHDEARRTFH